MIAAGVDLGGTKIEVQLFDANWRVVGQKRVATPRDYDALVTAIADQIHWAKSQAGRTVPIGIGAAGLLNPETGNVLTANLCASGRPLPRDIMQAGGQGITYINDCRALALSEAVFGAGRGHRIVASLILGTGVGGGLAVEGALLEGQHLTGGEFGHTAAPARIVAAHGLPVVTCGCGQDGCAETLIAGPGLTRVARAMTGQDLSPPEIAARRRGDMAEVWSVWCALVADLLRNLALTVDPDIVVLAGGLSQIDGVVDDLSAALDRARIGDYGVPAIALAEGGAESGARGAAYAAWQEVS